MFQSAVIKLTVWYVVALFVVISFFSIAFYAAGANRIERAAVRQGEILREFPGRPAERFGTELNNRRERIQQQEQNQLMTQIILIDVLLLLAGGAASYYFAKRTLKPIEESHLAQTQFTANASHQLRTPLAVMQTEIELALKNKNSDKKFLRSVLESNLEEVERLKKLSHQLLILNQINANDTPLKPLDLSKLISTQTDLLRKKTKQTIELKNTPKINIVGDEVLLAEVLTIIAENAIKYGDKKSPIAIKLSKNNNYAMFTITNTGPEIAQHEISRIFERFYRGTQAEDNPGHGLGLALAKSIVEFHAGTISAESKNNLTTFTINLPLA